MPTRKTCKGCVFWAEWNGWRESFHYCDAPGSTGAERPETRLYLKVDAADDTDLSGYLLTGPDFGCVLHESRAGAI